MEILHTAAQRMSCPEHKFICATGHCIPAAWHCDDAADCPDGSDEHQCGKSMDDKPSMIIGMTSYAIRTMGQSSMQKARLKK